MPKLIKIETSSAVDTNLPADGFVNLYLGEENSTLVVKAKKSDGTIVTIGGTAGASALNFYKCASVTVLIEHSGGTWDGYKWDPATNTFATDLTEGLTYTGEALTVGKIYTEDGKASFVNTGDTTATPSDVRPSTYFYNSSGALVQGTMAAAVQPTPTITASATGSTITAAYTPVAGLVTDVIAKTSSINLTTVSSDLIASNIKKNVNLFGVIGTLDQGTDVSDTTATPLVVLSGYSFYNSAGNKVSGTIATGTQPVPTITMDNSGVVTAKYTTNVVYVDSATEKSSTLTIPVKTGQTYTPTTTDQTIARYHWLTGDQVILGDANLLAENIKRGVSIFGVAGSLSGGTDVSDTTATVSTVLSGYVFYNSSGYRSTGTIRTIPATELPPVVLINGATISITQEVMSGYVANTHTYSNVIDIVSLDQNLVPQNIAQGVSIFGVVGTHSGGGDTVYYKCASVTPGAAGGVVVSGAGIPACDGTYMLTDSSLVGDARIWTNGTYYISKTTEVDLWIITLDSTRQEYPNSGVKYAAPDSVEPWEEEWIVSSGGVEPAPTVAEGQASQGSWTGYMATIAATGITYASSVTSGLTFSSTTPVVNGIYNNGCTKRIYEDTLIPGNIRKNVTILGVTGTYEGSGGEGDTVTTINIIKPQNACHILVKKAASYQALTTATTIIDTKNDATTRSLVRGNLLTATDSVWNVCPADGFGSPYDGSSIALDLSSITSSEKPCIIYYAWYSDSTPAELSDWSGVVFPASYGA